MATTQTTKSAFTPFVVAGQKDNIFRVIHLADGISKEAVRRILEKLPIAFNICKEERMGQCDYINEPLEVEASAQVIYIYPPKHRIVACTFFASHTDTLVRKMNIHCVMDTSGPGFGQIRTCIHFDPKIFGVRQWRDKAVDEIEVDIHVFPRTKTQEPKLETYRFGKHELRSLLELVAGGERPLSREQLRRWLDLIMYAVRNMRSNYENPDVAEDYPVRVYYKPLWQKVDTAGNDDQKLIDALEDLRLAIQWE